MTASADSRPLVLAVALGVLACGGREEPTEVPHTAPVVSPSTVLEEDPLAGLLPLDLGEALYDELECADCHESAAVPGMIVIRLRKLGARFTQESLSAFLAAPPPPMPNFELTKPHRDGLATYLLATFD